MLGMVATPSVSLSETVDESKSFSHKIVGDVSDQLIEQNTERNEV